MKMRSRLAVALLAAGTALAPAALADWLVTNKGERIQTEGSWRVKGNTVVFTLPNGTLSSLRTSEIDLDASAVATRQAAAASEQAAADAEEKTEEPKPVLVLTNKDISRAAPPRLPTSDDAESTTAQPLAAGGAAPAATDEGAPPAQGGSVQVVSWQVVEGQQGIEVLGTLRNGGGNLEQDVRLRVTATNQNNQVLGESDAFLRINTLGPSQSTSFRALFPNLVSLPTDPSFQVSSRSMVVTGENAEPEADTEDDTGG